MFILDGQEILAHPLLGQFIWRQLAELSQFPHGAEISLLSAFAAADQLQILAHFLAEFGGKER